MEAVHGTVAAQDFEKHLPASFCGYDCGTDICCAAASGLYDPLEVQHGWCAGDIALGNGWLVLLYGGPEVGPRRRPHDHRPHPRRGFEARLRPAQACL